MNEIHQLFAPRVYIFKKVTGIGVTRVARMYIIIMYQCKYMYDHETQDGEEWLGKDNNKETRDILYYLVF